MKETKSNSYSKRWTNIEVTFRERARRYERSAAYDMLIIILTLFTCIVVFAGADKLSGWIFKTSDERKADIYLANAKAEIYRSISSLGKPVSDFIRSLPPKIKPFLEEKLDEYLEQQKSTVFQEKNKINDTFTTKPNESIGTNKSPINKEEIVSPKKKSGARIPFGDFVEKSPTLTNAEQITKLYDALFRMYEKYSELHLSLELERERQSELLDKEHIEQIRSDSQIEIADIRAMADRYIAEKKAEAEFDIASEETQRAQELNALVSGAFTRIGAVVMVIWLVRIFVKKRQRSVKVASFYLAVADAIAMSKKQDHNTIKDIIPHLLPPDTEEDGGVETPIEVLAKVIGEYKRSG